MKKSHVFIFIDGFVLGAVVALLAIWALISKHQQPHRAARTEKLKIMNNGVEVHTLMLDQYNTLIGYLEDEGQTNALDLFRQYRCADGADMSASELGETLMVLQNLGRGNTPQKVREGNEEQAISLLEQQLSRYASLTMNCYGGLYPTNRERVNLEPLKQARDYFHNHPSPAWDPKFDAVVSEVLGKSP